MCASTSAIVCGCSDGQEVQHLPRVGVADELERRLDQRSPSGPRGSRRRGARRATLRGAPSPSPRRPWRCGRWRRSSSRTRRWPSRRPPCGPCRPCTISAVICVTSCSPSSFSTADECSLPSFSSRIAAFSAPERLGGRACDVHQRRPAFASFSHARQHVGDLFGSALGDLGDLVHRRVLAVDRRHQLLAAQRHAPSRPSSLLERASAESHRRARRMRRPDCRP